MVSTFGEAFTSIPHEKTGPGSKFMQEFECCKRDFGVSQDPTAEHEVTLVMEGVENSDHYDVDENKIKFTS